MSAARLLASLPSSSQGPAASAPLASASAATALTECSPEEAAPATTPAAATPAETAPTATPPTTEATTAARARAMLLAAADLGYKGLQVGRRVASHLRQRGFLGARVDVVQVVSEPFIRFMSWVQGYDCHNHLPRQASEDCPRRRLRPPSGRKPSNLALCLGHLVSPRHKRSS